MVMLPGRKKHPEFGMVLDSLFLEMKSQLSPEEYGELSDEMIEAPLLALDFADAIESTAKTSDHSVRTVLLAVAIVYIELSSLGKLPEKELTRYMDTTTEIAKVLRNAFQEFIESRKGDE